MYPDGFFLGIVRKPEEWLLAIRRHGRLGALNGNERASILLDQWKKSAEQILEARINKPENTLVVNFDDLILDTDRVVRQLCRRIDVPFEPTLLTPTCNGIPIEGNLSPRKSVEPVLPGKINKSVVHSLGESLTDGERQLIQDGFHPVFESREGYFE